MKLPAVWGELLVNCSVSMSQQNTALKISTGGDYFLFLLFLR